MLGYLFILLWYSLILCWWWIFLLGRDRFEYICIWIGVSLLVMINWLSRNKYTHYIFQCVTTFAGMTLWPSGLRRNVKAVVFIGVGSNPIGVTFGTCSKQNAYTTHHHPTTEHTHLKQKHFLSVIHYDQQASSHILIHILWLWTTLHLQTGVCHFPNSLHICSCHLQF